MAERDLVERVRGPVTRRALVEFLAGVDPIMETPGVSARARQAVLADTDRAGWSGGPAGALWERWPEEPDPVARAVLLLALGAADPGGAGPVLAEAAVP
jgi:hypothetical protein